MNTIQQIAAQLPGHDPQAMTATQVGDFLARLVEPLRETETIGLSDALGRVLASDVISPVSVPPHDNSAMDGYAFDGTSLAGATLTLRCVGTALAGRARAGTAGPGECLKIMTGAVLPSGLDTVIPVELARVDGEHVQVPATAVRRGDNRRLAGEDIAAGSAALRRGQLLGPAALGLLASLGLPTVEVLRRARVALLSTGDEILDPGEAAREGAIYDSNRYTLMGLLTRLGAEVIDCGAVPDDPQRLEAAFRDATARADAVITSGGVSMGDADHTRALMQRLGDVVFWRIAMRPGRPMAVGRLRSGSGSALLFGLPGNPVATMVTFLAFVRPALLRLMGAEVSPPLPLQARCAEVLHKKPGRTEYQRGIVSRAADGSLHVRTTGPQGSGVLSSMVQANGLIVLGHDQGNVAVGDMVEVLMFDGVI